MDKKHVRIIAWVLFAIIVVPLLFLFGMWVFIPIIDLLPYDTDVIQRVFGIVTAFWVTVLFLPISKKYIKVILAIILFDFLLSGIIYY